MVTFPTLFITEGRGRSGYVAKDCNLEGSSDDDTGTVIDVATGGSSPDQADRVRRLAGHPCASGCGHICWVAIGPGNVDGELHK
jgi:hypothetical protein